MTDGNELIPAANMEIIEASGVNELLSQVRPQWQAKSLIQRVSRILPIDPSSACQRMFNASIHDLREKIVVAGLDIAIEAAKQYKLPPISKAEDIEMFRDILIAAGYTTIIRKTRGDDINAACGQLVGKVFDRTRRQQKSEQKAVTVRGLL